MAAALIRQLEAIARDPGFSSDDNHDESDADSDTLEVAEEEARRLPITRKHVGLFDKQHDGGTRKRRYISCSERDLQPQPEVGSEEFEDLFRTHVKRKKMRRKLRLQPQLNGEEEDSFTINQHREKLKAKMVPPAKIGNEKKNGYGNGEVPAAKARKNAKAAKTPKTPKVKNNSMLKARLETPSSAQASPSGSNVELDTPDGPLSINIPKMPKPLSGSAGLGKRTKGKKEGKTKEKGPPTTDQLNAKRRRLWVAIMKRELGRGQKARNYNQKERLANCKRVAVNCQRQVRQKALASQRAMRETTSRAKKLTREMQAYWRKFDRVDRIQKRKQEKKEEEQQKQDLQILESKRQHRKLNFLITQTELYAHFMAKKIGTATETSEKQILEKLEEDKSLPKLSENSRVIDDYDSAEVKSHVLENANAALEVHRNVTQSFDDETHLKLEDDHHEERLQPSIFKGTLKKYQLKGMNWLLNLYDQGINGILADEMGLGKTIQSLAMLAYIAESYNIWGPFLVITPASTLHNWQQEVAKFLPSFKVVPYWGSPQERKILRHFWDQSNLHTKSASFHLVITSYQLVITDFKFFNRIKWQYLILDEAQAIKSSSSQRWKMLLEFRCRNRLLLSGTPIQNSMAELWALLHFVMPTLFDSHDEFNDWFSKDIESSAESNRQVDEQQISRLHMILKPFMLRRIKKDVENELTDKVEVLMYCPLTIRQTHLYKGLKQNIQIEELLKGLGSQSTSSSLTSSLLNLVMQFRKVCNHPELFERREARSPFVFYSQPYIVPKLVFHYYKDFGWKAKHLQLKWLSIYHPEHVNAHREGSSFAFLKLAGVTPGELHSLATTARGKLKRFIDEVGSDKSEDNYHRWHRRPRPILDIVTSRARLVNCDKLVYEAAYTRMSVKVKSMKETLEHRVLRSKNLIDGLAKEVPYVPRPDRVLDDVPVSLPLFLVTGTCPRVQATTKLCYAYDSAWHPIFRIEDPVEAADKQCFQDRQWLPWAREGWSNIVIPDKETLVSDAGKLFVLDTLLTKLKFEGHRVLIYSQMTKMIDLLEEYMQHRKHTYIRLDGSSKIHERRDMVNDFQQRSDIFVFLLSTRAGGLGINLTAADTVIFYDSDWNPTVDQQAMDRAHRLGQTKQVTVYRLICKGTIEERILERAKEKSEIQRMVIQGGSFKGIMKPNELRPKEVVSLLLDDDIKNSSSAAKMVETEMLGNGGETEVKVEDVDEKSQDA